MMLKRNIKLKVIILYAAEDEAKKTDQILFNTKFEEFKFMSFKLSASLQHLGAMYYNKMCNPKAKYKALFETQVEDKVVHQGRNFT